jgi:hypothetical protein
VTFPTPPNKQLLLTALWISVAARALRARRILLERAAAELRTLYGILTMARLSSSTSNPSVDACHSPTQHRSC